MSCTTKKAVIEPASPAMAGVTPAIDNAVGQLEPPDDGDTGHDRRQCSGGRGATAKQSGQDGHEQAHAHDGPSWA